MLKHKVKRKGDRGEALFYAAIVAFPLLQILVFYFYVNFNSILLCFKDWGASEKTPHWVGFENFKDLWKDVENNILIDAFKNSILVWIFVSGLGTFLSILFSYYIFKKWATGKMFKFFLFLPSVVPSLLFVIIYRFFMDEALPGYMLDVFGKKMQGGLFSGPYDTIMPVVIFFNVWVCFGSQVLIYTGAMDQITPDILEAGKIDGVSSTQEFFKIVIPMILPTVSTFVVASVATIFTNQAGLYAFGGDKYTSENSTLGSYLYTLVDDAGVYDTYGYASALGVVCTCIAIPLTMGVRKLLNRGEE